jgi:hypothetical protein
MSEQANNRDSTQNSEAPVAKVYPSKKSYQSIAADVSVDSALAELIDNSIDSAVLNGDDSVEIEIYFDEEAEDLVYSDHAGGVAQEEMGVFLGLGRSKEAELDGLSIGAFGMGTKKALNHLATSFTVASRHSEADQGWQYTVDPEWFDEDNEKWEFEMEPSELDPGQTEIQLHQLAFDWNEQKEEIKNSLSKKYQRFFSEEHQTRVEISLEIDGETVKPPGAVDWSYSPWQEGAHPRKFVGLEFTNERWSAPISAEVTVGLLREGDIQKVEPGTAVFCQNRLVEEGLTNEKGGFGVNELNKFNSARDGRLRIEIDFYTEGNADDLPWNSDKSRISRLHEALSAEDGVYYWLRRFADRHKKIGLYGEAPPYIFTPYDASSPSAANNGEIEVVDVGSKQKRKRRGEINHPRIHEKPADNLSDIKALQRLCRAHAQLGIRNERIDWFESWMLPAYREGLFHEFKKEFETDDGFLTDLLDIDDVGEIVKDEKFDREEVLAALNEVDEAPDGKSAPWDEQSTITAKTDDIDSMANNAVLEGRRRDDLHKWAQARYDYIEGRIASQRDIDRGALETTGTSDSTPQLDEEPESEDTNADDQQSRSEASQSQEESTASSDSNGSTSNEYAQQSLADSPQESSESEGQASDSEGETESQDSSSRQPNLETIVEEYQDDLQRAGIEPDKDPGELISELLDIAVAWTQVQTLLEEAPVSGKSPEERLEALIEKADRFEQIMAAAQEG